MAFRGRIIGSERRKGRKMSHNNSASYLPSAKSRKATSSGRSRHIGRNIVLLQESPQRSLSMVANNTFEQDRAYLWNKFQAPVFDPDTGLDNETIKSNVMKLADKLKDLPHPVIKARAFEYVARNVRIDVDPHDWFVGFGCWDRKDRPLG